MADSLVKKLVIPKADLPPISAEDNSYHVRYRIISQEQLRRSQWSPVNIVPGNTAPTITQISVAVDDTNNTVTAVWSPPADYEIDTVFVFVKWSNSTQPSLSYEWKYVAKVSGTTYATVIPTTVTLSNGTTFTPNRVQIRVQVPTYPRIDSADATLFVSEIKNV
jgi:hypothetical protein